MLLYYRSIIHHENVVVLYLLHILLCVAVRVELLSIYFFHMICVPVCFTLSVVISVYSFIYFAPFRLTKEML